VVATCLQQHIEEEKPRATDAGDSNIHCEFGDMYCEFGDERWEFADVHLEVFVLGILFSFYPSVAQLRRWYILCFPFLVWRSWDIGQGLPVLDSPTHQEP
jgi:hypothetical protein